MPRRRREAMGGFVYHVINRATGRRKLFRDEGDYAAFERVLCQSQERVAMRLVGYCLMPNHWHLVVWPRENGQLSEWMRWVTVTHTQRLHAHRGTSGEGPVYQGRFKSFPIQEDNHLLAVLRYVERNALRANLVEHAEDWRWGSLWRWLNRRAMLEDVPVLCDWPTGGAGGPGGRPRNWVQRVNRPETEEELAALQQSVMRSRPYGDEDWVTTTAKRLGLESSLRPRGRPRKAKEVE